MVKKKRMEMASRQDFANLALNLAWEGLKVYRQMFSPADDGSHADPYVILGLKASASMEEVRGQYRSLAKTLHSDHGGSDFLFKLITMAKEAIENREGKR